MLRVRPSRLPGVQRPIGEFAVTCPKIRGSKLVENTRAIVPALRPGCVTPPKSDRDAATPMPPPEVIHEAGIVALILHNVGLNRPPAGTPITVKKSNPAKHWQDTVNRSSWRRWSGRRIGPGRARRGSQKQHADRDDIDGHSSETSTNPYRLARRAERYLGRSTSHVRKCDQVTCDVTNPISCRDHRGV